MTHPFEGRRRAQCRAMAERGQEQVITELTDQIEVIKKAKQKVGKDKAASAAETDDLQVHLAAIKKKLAVYAQ